MKTISKIILLGLAVALMQACGNAAYEKQNSETSALAPLADSVMTELVPSSAAKGNGNDSNRQFIRTANLKFKVVNVERSTYAIEDIIAGSGGFVINTQLHARIDYTESFRIKEDSILQRTHYTVENTVIFRVPNSQLDTTLKQIASQIDFLDHRIIKAEDVSFQAMKNKLSEKRFQNHEKRLNKAIQKQKDKDIVEAEDNLFYKQEQAEENAVDNLELYDKINYSTVELLIYQPERTREQRVFSELKQPEYKPSFGKEFIGSLKFGWQMVEFLFLLCVKLWPLLLIGVGVYYLIKHLLRKK